MWGGAGFALLLLSIVVSVSMGTATIPLSDTWAIVLHQVPFLGDLVHSDWPVSSEQIISKVRLPRVLLAALVGACLSLAGAPRPSRSDWRPA